MRARRALKVAPSAPPLCVGPNRCAGPSPTTRCRFCAWRARAVIRSLVWRGSADSIASWATPGAATRASVGRRARFWKRGRNWCLMRRRSSFRPGRGTKSGGNSSRHARRARRQNLSVVCAAPRPQRARTSCRACTGGRPRASRDARFGRTFRRYCAPLSPPLVRGKTALPAPLTRSVRARASVMGPGCRPPRGRVSPTSRSKSARHC